MRSSGGDSAAPRRRLAYAQYKVRVRPEVPRRRGAPFSPRREVRGSAPDSRRLSTPPYGRRAPALPDSVPPGPAPGLKFAARPAAAVRRPTRKSRAGPSVPWVGDSGQAAPATLRIRRTALRAGDSETRGQSLRIPESESATWSGGAEALSRRAAPLRRRARKRAGTRRAQAPFDPLQRSPRRVARRRRPRRGAAVRGREAPLLLLPDKEMAGPRRGGRPVAGSVVTRCVCVCVCVWECGWVCVCVCVCV